MIFAVVARAALIEVSRHTADLRTDAPAGNTRPSAGSARFSSKTVVYCFFHAHRAAAAPDIAGDFVDVSDVYIATLFSPTLRAAAFRSSSAATGMTKTK